MQAIFAKYVDEHLGAKAIANWLNDTGRRTRTGNLWTGQAVLRLLRNPVYLGKIRHDDVTHDGKHDAILDTDRFEQAQKLLDDQAAEAADRAAASDYLLSGLTRCTSCGGAYIGAGAQGKNRYYRYYVCRSQQTKGQRACCSQRVPAEDLENGVIDALLDTYCDLDQFEQGLRHRHGPAPRRPAQAPTRAGPSTSSPDAKPGRPSSCPPSPTARRPSQTRPGHRTRQVFVWGYKTWR